VSGALPGTLYAFVMVSALSLLMWRLRESLLALLPLVLALAWTNPNSPPDATPESASAENHSPETATEADSRYRAAHRRLRWARKTRGFVAVVSQRGW
jgi:hypothetical protein